MKINNGDNFNGGDNKPRKPSALVDVFLGLGISALLVVAMFGTFSIGKPAIISIIEIIIISCSTFLAVRFLRRERTIIGVFMLATIIPMTLLLMLMGSCGLMLS